jgi:hypothetical protein
MTNRVRVTAINHASQAIAGEADELSIQPRMLRRSSLVSSAGRQRA